MFVKDEVLKCFLEYLGSTTVFLERLLGESIIAQVIDQRQSSSDHGPTLERWSILRGRRTGPLVAAQCSLNIQMLTDVELEGVRNSDTPIGRVLIAQGPDNLVKTRLTVEEVTSGQLPQMLDTGEHMFFVKRYQLWHRDRWIGAFFEAVSSRSLARAVAADGGRVGLQDDAVQLVGDSIERDRKSGILPQRSERMPSRDMELDAVKPR